MSSIDPGATGIPPVTPNVYSPTNSLAARTFPLTLDASALSEQVVISIPPPSPNTPTLPLAEYFQSVNEAAVRQKIQEFLDAFNDATKLSAMWQDSIDQAVSLRDYINQIYAIVDLQNAILKQGGLAGAITDINATIAAYNAGVTGPGGDQEQVQTLNNAINNYNSANSSYQSALQNYSSALNNQQNALNTYNSAVATWDAALNSYLAGTLDQAGLEAARAQFDSAKANFDNTSAATANAQSALSGAESNLQAAGAALETAKNNYNAYVSTRSAAVDAANTAINAWNDLANRRNAQITELNALRAALNPPLPPYPLIPTIPPINALQPYQIPGGSVPPLAVDVNGRIGTYNSQAASLSNYIASQLNFHIFSINNTGYQPPIPEQPGITQYPFNAIFPVSSGDLALLPIPNLATSVEYTPFTPTDVVTIYLLPRLQVLDVLKNSQNKAENYSKLQANLDVEVPDLAGQQNTIGGAGASVAMTTITPKTLMSTPFLDRILSKQSFEAFFNFFGAPIASPLVDQLGAITAHLLTTVGLSSAGPASTIIGTGSFGNIGGESTLSVAVSLGFLKQISNVVSSELLPQSIIGAINGEPSLSFLSAAQKQELADLISASVSRSMLEIGLNDVARSLSIPGLTPQILATVAGLTTQDALVALGGQLYAETLLAQHIEEQSTLSHEEALDVSQKTLQQIFVGENTSPQELQAQVVNAMLNQFSDAQADSISRVRAGEIVDAVIDQIIADRMEQADIQKDTFRQAVIRGLQRVQNLDERDASRIADRVMANGDSVGSLSQAAMGILPKVGLTEVEASQVVRSAVEAYNTRDPLLNPLSAPSLQKIVSSADLAVLFKTEIVNALSPVIGKRALDVAEDYGNLVFSSSTSVLNKLEGIDRQERKSINSLDNRVFDKYLEATRGYKDPGTILERMTAPGRALVGASVIGAPSAHGISPIDNALGRGPLQG